MSVTRSTYTVRRDSLLTFAAAFTVAILWTFVVFPRFSAVERIFDMNGFGQIAENVYHGRGFSYDGIGPTIRRAPLYPYLMAGLFSVFGFRGHSPAGYTSVLVMQCMFAGLTCVFAYLTASRLFGRRVALTAAALCTVWPQCLRYLGAVEVEATMTVLIAAITYLAVRLCQQPTVGNGALFGLAVALASLTKPVPLLLPLSICLLLMRDWRTADPNERRDRRRALLTAFAVLVAVIMPWSVRNHIVSSGRYRQISSNAPGEFLRGFVTARPEYAFLRREFRANWDGDANAFENGLLAPYGLSMEAGKRIDNGREIEISDVDYAVEKDRVETREAIGLVSRDPAAMVRKFAIQLLTFWYLVETPSKSKLVGMFALLAWAGALLGMRKAKRHNIDHAPVTTVVLYFNVLYALLLAFARYSMPVYPALLVLAAAGFAPGRWMDSPASNSSS